MRNYSRGPGLRRRDVLGLGLFGIAGACVQGADLGKEAPMQGMDRFKMWGGTQALDLPATSGDKQSQQVVDIRFDRPDTWTFFLAFNIASLTGHTDGVGLGIDFDLTLGVGRANRTIPGFWHVDVASADVDNLFLLQKPLFVTETQQLSYVNPTDLPPTVVDHFPADQIQLVVRARWNGLIATSVAQVLVSGFFAPRSHVRDDWFAPHYR